MEASNLGNSVESAYVLDLTPDGKIAVGSYQLKVNDPTEPPFIWAPTDGPPFAGAFVGISGDAVEVLKDGKKVTLPFAKLSSENALLAKRLDELTIRGKNDLGNNFAVHTKFVEITGDSIILEDPNGIASFRAKLRLNPLIH